MTIVDEAMQKKSAARHEAARQAVRDTVVLAPPPGYAGVLVQLQDISDRKAAEARRRKIEKSPPTAELQLTAGEQHQRQREIARLSPPDLAVFIEGLTMQRDAYLQQLEQLQERQRAIVVGDYVPDALDLSAIDDLAGGLGQARDELLENSLLPDLIIELQRRLKHVRFELRCAHKVQQDRVAALNLARLQKDAAGRLDVLSKALQSVDDHLALASKLQAKPQMSGRLSRALRAEIERLRES